MGDLVGRLRQAAATSPYTAVDGLLRGAADDIEALEAVVQRQEAEIAALKAAQGSIGAALAEAIGLLGGVDDDANNVRIDIARWQRRHHRWVDAEPSLFDDPDIPTVDGSAWK